MSKVVAAVEASEKNKWNVGNDKYECVYYYSMCVCVLVLVLAHSNARVIDLFIYWANKNPCRPATWNRRRTVILSSVGRVREFLLNNRNDINIISYIQILNEWLRHLVLMLLLPCYRNMILSLWCQSIRNHLIQSWSGVAWLITCLRQYAHRTFDTQLFGKHSMNRA